MKLTLESTKGRTQEGYKIKDKDTGGYFMLSPFCCFTYQRSVSTTFKTKKSGNDCIKALMSD